MQLTFLKTILTTRSSLFSYVPPSTRLIKNVGLKATGTAFFLALIFSCSAMADKNGGNSSKPRQVKVERLQPGQKPVQNNAIININTATASELTALINIGPAKANEIVAYRKANGNFVSIDQLANVKGIGTNTIEQNRKRIQVARKAAVKK
ncbi:MAG: comEA protein [Psychrobacter glaciei]|jgi:comEA protein